MVSQFQMEVSEWGVLTSLALLTFTLVIQRRYRKHEYSPAVLYSHLDYVDEEESLKIRFIKLPSHLKKIALLFFLLALCHPILKVPLKQKEPFQKNTLEEKEKSQKLEEQRQVPTEGIAIYFVLDQSGSMQADMGPMEGFGGPRQRMTRLEVLKQLTSRFIAGDVKLELPGRKEDLVGLVSFARVPKVLVPLTLEHEIVQKELMKLSAMKYSYEEGTAIGYAIYKTAHLIAATEHYAKQLPTHERPAYDIESTIMILVTDGFQNPHNFDYDHELRSMSVARGAEYAKEKGIRLYIINIEPALALAQYQEELGELKQAAESTGGQFFMVSNVHQLQKIYRAIDQIEKVKQKDPRKRQVIVEEKIKSLPKLSEMTSLELFPSLIRLGLLALFLALCLETTLLRRVP